MIDPHMIVIILLLVIGLIVLYNIIPISLYYVKSYFKHHKPHKLRPYDPKNMQDNGMGRFQLFRNAIVIGHTMYGINDQGVIVDSATPGSKPMFFFIIIPHFDYSCTLYLAFDGEQYMPVVFSTDGKVITQLLPTKSGRANILIGFTVHEDTSRYDMLRYLTTADRNMLRRAIRATLGI